MVHPRRKSYRLQRKIRLGRKHEIRYLTRLSMAQAVLFSFMEEKYMIDNQYPANDVYAIWKPISWTVKYDANGGSGTMADTTHTYNAHIPISNNQFNKAGYTFDGWQASRI